MKLLVYNEAGLIGCVLGLAIGILLMWWFLSRTGEYAPPEHEPEGVWRGETWRDHDAER